MQGTAGKGQEAKDAVGGEKGSANFCYWPCPVLEHVFHSWRSYFISFLDHSVGKNGACLELRIVCP